MEKAKTHDETNKDDYGLVRLVLVFRVRKSVGSEQERSGQRTGRGGQRDPAGAAEPACNPGDSVRPFGRRKDGGKVIGTARCWEYVNNLQMTPRSTPAHGAVVECDAVIHLGQRRGSGQYTDERNQQAIQSGNRTAGRQDDTLRVKGRLMSTGHGAYAMRRERTREETIAVHEFLSRRSLVSYWSSQRFWRVRRTRRKRRREERSKTAEPQPSTGLGARFLLRAYLSQSAEDRIDVQDTVGESDKR